MKTNKTQLADLSLILGFNDGLVGVELQRVVPEIGVGHVADTKGRGILVKRVYL